VVHCSADHGDLHSFPTRRSSDLDGGGDGIGLAPAARLADRGNVIDVDSKSYRFHRGSSERHDVSCPISSWMILFRRAAACSTLRSEEHTSELQSRSDLVCRLLLE